MRLGGPVHHKYDSPDSWVAAVRRADYGAAFCPIKADASDDVVRAYADAAKKADIVIAEVGAWSNPLSPDDATRKAAVEKCKRSLALADEKIQGHLSGKPIRKVIVVPGKLVNIVV
jgi:sugar phosphate isomerase/epimerase